MLEIKEIQPTEDELRKFTQFQIDLYKGNPYYVPPLIFVRRSISWPTVMVSPWGVWPEL